MCVCVCVNVLQHTYYTTPLSNQKISLQLKMSSIIDVHGWKTTTITDELPSNYGLVMVGICPIFRPDILSEIWLISAIINQG